MNLFAYCHAFLLRPRVFSRALTAGHAGSPCAHNGARLGPGRAPWRAIWAFHVAGSWLFTRDRFPPHRTRPKQVDGNPHNRTHHGRFSHDLLCITARTSGAAALQQQPRFKLFPLWQQRAVLLRVCACVCPCVPSYPATREYDRTLGTRNANTSRTTVLYILICFALLSAAATVTASQGPPHSSLCSSRGTTAAARQGRPLVTSHGRCLFVCVPSYGTQGGIWATFLGHFFRTANSFSWVGIRLYFEVGNRLQEIEPNQNCPPTPYSYVHARDSKSSNIRKGSLVHKHMEDNVAHVVPAIEKSDLDQVMSRERPRSR